MPRRRPPRRDELAPARSVSDVERVERRGGREWTVRRLSGASSTRTYTCPACHRSIPPATAHVVVWPVEKSLLSAEAVDERRHWHHDCWRRGLR